MTARLLDTNIVSFMMKSLPLARIYRRHIIGRPQLVSFMTVAELREGSLQARWGPKRLAELESWLSRFVQIDSNESLCRRWGHVRHERRRQPIGVADAWIAATALEYDLELITHNPSDFQGIAGLRVITEAP